MATFNERISVVIDVVTDKATKGFKDFRTAVGEANGFTGKLKAGVSSLGSVFTGAVGGPAALGAAVAGGAKIAFDAAQEWAALGEQVGNFASVTGVSTETASRWIEVAGDLGVEAGTLESTLGKLNKSIDPKLFDSLGISIARTSSGAVDTAATFENVLQKIRQIKDPTEQAKTAAKLLGKGWQAVAPLIARSAEDIKSQLKGVADVKVFTAEEVKKAKEFKDKLRELDDKFGELKETIGQAVVPALTDALDGVLKLADGMTWLDDQTQKLGFSLGDLDLPNPAEWAWDWGWSQLEPVWNAFNREAPKISSSVAGLGDAAGMATRAVGLLADQQKRIADHTYIAKDSLDQARTALKKYQDQIKGRNDLIDLVTELDDISTKLNGITMLHAANEISDRDYWLQSAQLVGDAQVAVSDYLDTLNELPPTVKTKLLAEFDPNAPQKFLEDLQAELDRRKVKIGVVPRYVTGPQDGPNTDPRNTTPRPGDNSGNTKGESASGFSRNVPIPVNITVNVPPGANLVDIGRVTADALAAFYRAGGERP